MRSQVEIEAAIKEFLYPAHLFTAEEVDRLWVYFSTRDKAKYMTTFGRVLDAADAVAADVAKGEQQ